MRRIAAFLGGVLAVALTVLVFTACLVLLPSVLTPDESSVTPQENVPAAPHVDVGPLDHGLWYDQLSSAQQALFDQMLGALRARQDTFVLEGATADDVAPAYQAIIGDHPEFFWLTGGYTYREAPQEERVEVTPKLTVAADEVEGLQAQIDEVAEGVLAQIPDEAGDYERVRACYEWVIDNTVYEDAGDSQNIKSVFLGGVSVCAGYARAFQYLMHKQGIRCDYLSGGGHAWNLVWIAGTPTYVDTTWGDPVFIAENGERAPESKTYDYLCLTADALYRIQTLEMPTTDRERLPACDATDYDYYRLNGLFFDSFDSVDLARVVGEVSAAGGHAIRVKYASDEAFEQAYAYAQGEEIFYIGALADAGTVYVGGEPRLRILSLEW